MKKNMEPYHVIFEVKKIKGELLPGSSLKKGERFVGEYNPNSHMIYFEDLNNQQWWFKPNLDCIIVDSI